MTVKAKLTNAAAADDAAALKFLTDFETNTKTNYYAFVNSRGRESGDFMPSGERWASDKLTLTLTTVEAAVEPPADDAAKTGATQLATMATVAMAATATAALL